MALYSANEGPQKVRNKGIVVEYKQGMVSKAMEKEI